MMDCSAVCSSIKLRIISSSSSSSFVQHFAKNNVPTVSPSFIVFPQASVTDNSMFGDMYYCGNHLGYHFPSLHGILNGSLDKSE